MDNKIDKPRDIETNEGDVIKALQYIATYAKDLEIEAVYTLALVREAKENNIPVDFSKGPDTRQHVDQLLKSIDTIRLHTKVIGSQIFGARHGIDTATIEERLVKMGYSDTSVQHWREILHNK